MAAFLAVLVATASATVAAAEGSAWVIRHGPRAEKVVALTFDDGWGRAASERILAVLIAENVPATFFPYALAVRSNPVLWRRIAEAGFPIGNHTWSHPRMTSLTQHEMEWQIAASKRLIESVTGVPMLRVFRPPYGRYDRRVLAAAANQGFPTVLLWDASAGDSGAGPSRASVLRGASAGRNGSVVLLHAARTVTASALRDDHPVVPESRLPLRDGPRAARGGGRALADAEPVARALDGPVAHAGTDALRAARSRLGADASAERRPGPHGRAAADGRARPVADARTSAAAGTHPVSAVGHRAVTAHRPRRLLIRRRTRDGESPVGDRRRGSRLDERARPSGHPRPRRGQTSLNSPSTVSSSEPA